LLGGIILGLLSCLNRVSTYFSKRNKYNIFANNLGYHNWEEMNKYTFFIHDVPEEWGCFATFMPNKKWAVWEDYGYPPYLYIEFSDWKEAIYVIRTDFEKKGWDEDCWDPEGYDEGDNEYVTPPDRNKIK
jgi:hypothetical protein